MDERPRDENDERRRRAERLRRAVADLAGGEAGERPTPRPRGPHELVEETMREEAERREREQDEEDER